MTVELSKVGDGAGNTVYSIFIAANQGEIDGTNTEGPNVKNVSLKEVNGGFLFNTETWQLSTLCVKGKSKTWVPKP